MTASVRKREIRRGEKKRKRKEEEVTIISVFDTAFAVFDVILVLHIFSKLGTCEDDFYLSRILAAFTSM